jgi:glycosyltransferase involved in cell wall biosynthesis
VALTLAGPAADASAQRLIDEAVARHPQQVRHLGPVYDADKAKFFDEIDAFVFPTMTESWGLVLNESLGMGVPVITFNRGCTATVVGDAAGRLIDPAGSFVEEASKQVAYWMDHEDEYTSSSRAAVAQAEYLHREGQRTLADFVHHMYYDELPAAG